MTECDVVVLGLGPGGEAAATRLAGAGLHVVAIDRRLVGGECPYYGCVPSKMMLHAAGTLAQARRVKHSAGAAEVHPDYTPVHRRIREEATTDWDDSSAVQRLEEAGVAFVRGHGRLAGTGRVHVDGAPDGEFTARRGVLLNTGTEPAVPSIDGLQQTPYWTNREALRAGSLPGSLVVIGGGSIGAELAQAFARFGVLVTLVETADGLLPSEEPAAGRLVAESLEQDGIRIRTDATVRRVQHEDGRFTLDLGDARLGAERVLVATGRTPNLTDIGLDTVGLDPGAASLPVDGRMRAADRLWGIGDITGHGMFTHLSMYQAEIAADDILGQHGPTADYRALTHVTFTDPQVGVAGLTEAEARGRGIDTVTARTGLGARGWIAETDGLIKLVAGRDDGLLLGATAVAPCGGEVIGLLATAVHARVPVSTLRTMHFAYPTYHRAIQTALQELSDAVP